MSWLALSVGLHWAAVGLYAVASAIFAHAVVFAHQERVRWGLRAAALGLVPHTAALALRWISSSHGPYLARFEVLSSDAWVAIALLLIFLWRRPAWAAVGMLALPAAFLTIAGALFTNPAIRDLPPTFRSIWLVFHIGFAKLSAGSFLLSVATSVLVLLRERNGREWLSRLPPTEALDAYTVRFVGFGFVFWTVTVIAGAIWANQSWGRYWGWDTVETWSLITWLVYGTFLHARLLFKTGVRATASMGLACFGLFVLTILVLPYLMPSIHSAYFQ